MKNEFIASTLIVIVTIIIFFILVDRFAIEPKVPDSHVEAVSEQIYVNDKNYFQVLDLKWGNYCSIMHTPTETKVINCWR